MKIWIITVGEPLPTDGPAVRLYRSGILSKLLASQGHEVTWWSSTFDHIARRQRHVPQTSHPAGYDFQLKLIYSPGYKKSVGLARIWSHTVSAGSFMAATKSVCKPDIILVSYPTIELCFASLQYARKRNVPVIIDIRDLWPDLFIDVFPDKAKIFVRPLLLPYELMAREVLKKATSIVGVTDDFVDWAYRKANRASDRNSQSFAMGYETIALEQSELHDALQFWSGVGVQQSDWIACFFGTLGRQFDLEIIIESARLMQDKGIHVKFVICGDGDNAERYRSMAKGLNNVVFPGWVDRNQIQALMSISKIGLAPYISSKNFLLNIPNKPIEYLSKGLPILSTIRGSLGRLISENEVGIICDDGDPLSIVNALQGLYQHSNRLVEMSKASKQLFEKNFRADVVYAKFGNYLEGIASSYARRNISAIDNS